MRRLAIAIIVASLSGCAAIPQKAPFAAGQWGGPHASLLIEGGIGTLEFDCAGGTIDSTLPSSGTFSLPGTYRAGQGGPVRVGQIFTSQRATYSGSIAKDVMTLTARLEDGTLVGPFTLTRGASPMLTRCL